MSERAPASRRELLRWQFEFTWSLLEYHLAALDDADLLWEPTANCWTMRPVAGDGWEPDWAETEPDPIPVPTLGWVSWHLGWWWSVTLDHVRGHTPRDRTDIHWPGDARAVVGWLRDLREEWLAALDDLTDDELDGPAPFPWQDQPEMTVAHMLGWVNGELMKNVAEIGQLRVLRRSTA